MQQKKKINICEKSSNKEYEGKVTSLTLTYTTENMYK